MSGLCAATKRDGTPCRAYATTGSDLCAGHAGYGLAANPKAAASQSAVLRQRQAETGKKRAIEVYREAVEAHAEAFVAARLSIINDQTASAGDRLRAMEQLESRALGKPKETVEHQADEPEYIRALRALTPEQRLTLWRNRGLRVVEDAGETGAEQ